MSTPGQPIRLEGAEAKLEGDHYQLTFGDQEASKRRYAAAAPAGLLKPAAMQLPPSPLETPANGADYIVIAHPSLVEAVQPLLTWRQEQGLRTTLVTTEQVFDRFSQGVPDPAAITDFLRWASTEWPGPAPRFVLLAGDASYDPRDFSNGPNKDLVPTHFHPTTEMGETAGDNPLADITGDGLPDLAIGRLPAQTPAQMAAMVAKTIAYEQGDPQADWRRRLLFVADDDDSFFPSFNTEMIATLPSDLQVEELSIGVDEDVRSRLLDALNEGVGVLSYMGHGAIDIWAREEILGNDDIAGLRQNGRLPFVVVWACLSGYFQHPELTSLGETLLLTPNAGAVAALVPTGETFPQDQQVMAAALLQDHLLTTPTVGEALLASFRELDPKPTRPTRHRQHLRSPRRSGLAPSPGNF